MWIATRISSYSIPHDVWGKEEGTSLLQLPALDAAHIERRAHKEVNLRQEARRHALCSERMQGIARDLALAGALPPPLVWPAADATASEGPRALAYLAIIERFALAAQTARRRAPEDLRQALLLLRLEGVFFPPGSTRTQMNLLDKLIGLAGNVSAFYEAAAQRACDVVLPRPITAAECEQALNQRRQLLQRCADANHGLIDVIELI